MMQMQETKMASRKNVNDVLARIAEYKPVPTMTLPQRIAHFLDWAASHVKKTYFQYNIVCKAINGYTHTPRLDTKEVENVRGSMTRVKQILRDKYKRGFDYSRGLGIRGTTDDNDTVNYTLASATKRWLSGKANVDNVAAIVDPAKLSLKEASYFKSVTGASRLITTQHIQNLLPPKPAPASPSKKQP